METKRCSRCGEEKPLSEFKKNPRNKDGYEYTCKICESKRQKEWRLKNRDAIKEYQKRYNEAHRLQKNAGQRQRYLKSKGGILKRQSEYYKIYDDDFKKSCRIREKIYMANYRLKHRNRLKQQRKQYYTNNREEILLKAKERDTKNRVNLSDSYIISRLKGRGFSLSDITPELIELKRQQLKLERAYRLLNKEMNKQNK